MSPVSRSRKKKSRTVRRRPRSSPFAAVLAEAAGLLEQQSPVAAQMWASELLGAIWAAAWEADDEPDDAMSAGVEELVEYAMAKRGPAALALLRAVGTVGEDWSRELATGAADDLAAEGVAEPPWVSRASSAELTDAYTMADPFGDLELIALGFTDHLVVVLLAHLDHPSIARIMFGEAAEGDLAASVRQVGGDGFGDPRALTPAEARARLEWPLELLLDEGPSVAGLVNDEPDDPEADGGDPAAGWALLRARLDELPDDEVATAYQPVGFDGEQVVKDFPGYAPGPLARGWASLVTEWAEANERSPYRWGPISLGAFLLEDVAPHGVIAESDRPAFTATVEAWLRFAADAGGLPADIRAAWGDALPDVLEDFFAAYDDPAATAHRAECPESFDLRSYPEASRD